jgi:ubiquinone/menaquinone biosynthesis C-methylase UbiE
LGTEQDRLFGHSMSIPFPPQEFMDAVAGQSVSRDQHIAIGRQLFALLNEKCAIKPTDTILDIGCGCGRVAAQFVGQHHGEYHGFDVVLSMIEWCRKNISSKYPDFHFHHADLANTLYSKTGASAASYNFPFAERTFDVAFAASVFTHLLPHSARNYAREIGRVLKPQGRAFLTFFLIHCDTADARRKGEEIFPYRLQHHAVASLENPEAVVAFETSDAIAMLEDANLKVSFLSPGQWSMHDGWTYQDVILATRLD